MEGLDYWRMCDDLNVIQCVLLILGLDPKDFESSVETSLNNRPQGYEAVSAAVKNAVRRGRLPAHIMREAWDRGFAEMASEGEEYGNDRGRTVIFRIEPDWFQTTVAVEDLKAWLETRKVKNGFFFTSRGEIPSYLDADNRHYSSKLAGALEAWEAVNGDKALTKNRSVKSALTIWLNKNAARFGLIKEDGTPNRQAIEEAAKVANWDLKGGAPKTPVEPTHPSKPS